MSYNAFLTIKWNGDKSALKTGLGIVIWVQSICWGLMCNPSDTNKRHKQANKQIGKHTHTRLEQSVIRKLGANVRELFL